MSHIGGLAAPPITTDEPASEGSYIDFYFLVFWAWEAILETRSPGDSG